MFEQLSTSPSPEFIADYCEQKLRAIQDGENVFIQRNFDGLDGRVLDFFSGGHHIGYIDQEYTDHLCDVFINSDDSKEGPVKLNEARLSLDEAEKALLDFNQPTDSPS